LIALLAFVFLTTTPSDAADTLPDRLSDDAFWKLIGALSETGGTFQSENLLSNETDFPRIMTMLKRTAVPGRVYLGVGPEQNFNYIATLRPKIAFIIDIRRQNMLEHLIYKALFEMSPDRASFISRLFSRRQPTGLTPEQTAAELFDAYLEERPDQRLFEKNLKEIEDRLTGTHRFTLTTEDRLHIENVYSAFREFGPLIDYNSRGGGFGGRSFSPSYTELMTETDDTGREWSYLASEANYRFIRDLENSNLIVPLTGDFGGPKAIRAIGQYLKDHDAVVSAFYTSNVEGYLFQGGDRRGNPNGGAAKFYDNAAALPLDMTSTFIRWVPGARGRPGAGTSIVLAPMFATIDDFNAGRFTATDLFPPGGFGRTRGFIGGFLNNGRQSRAPVERSNWIARVRIIFPLLAAAAAFLVRRFIWRPMDVGEGWRRKTLYSVAWAIAAYVLAVGLVVLIHPTVPG